MSKNFDARQATSTRLSQFFGRGPIELVFGTFTGPPFVAGAVSLRDLYRDYNDRVRFIVIYTTEAHPIDGWYTGGNHDIRQHLSMEERRDVAAMCEVALQYGIKTYVDEIDNAVSEAYASMPDRLYLVGTDGRIAYAGGKGPFGFKPGELKDSMDEHLAHLDSQ